MGMAYNAGNERNYYKSFVLCRKTTLYTYKTSVKSVNNQTASVVYRSEHSHGHGENANAGGSIVDFE